MALKGQAKTDYQREYMQRRRGSNMKGSNNGVRPIGKTHTTKLGFELKPRAVDAEGNIIPDYEFP